LSNSSDEIVEAEIFPAAVGFEKNLELIEIDAESRLNVLRDRYGSSHVDATPTDSVYLWHVTWS
jgi:hypothetical protein